MHLTYTPEQDKLRSELREYFAALMTPERRASLTSTGGDGGDGGGGGYREIVRQLGADGWLTLSWPTAYGGRGASVTDQLIFTDKAAAAGVPVLPGLRSRPWRASPRARPTTPMSGSLRRIWWAS